ncbi:MAG: ROK family transcriptional regulator [Halanaerobiales bacterium]|nr:ROK family transcriptional regulator [Halanaerobiales bacterium]
MRLGFNDMSRYNRITVLNLIRRNENISRSELAEKTGLTPPSISRITKELMERDLIIESGVGESHVGRKPIMIEFNESSRSIIGLDLRPDHINGVITDLSPTILKRYEKEFDINLTPNEILNLSRKFLTNIIEEAEKIAPLLGVGIVLPGVVDIAKGELTYSAPMGWSKIDIKSNFKEVIPDVPFKIDNLAHAVALGEKWLKSERERENFIYVYVGKGIGAGIIANGQIYHGSEYNAAEIGHSTINFNGPQCNCGNRGCLETYCSTKVLQSNIENELDIKIDSEEELWKILNSNDKKVKKIIEEALDYLGIGIANLINTLNPEKIIIGGWPQKIGYDQVLNYLWESAQEHSMEGLSDNIEVEFSYRDEDVGPLLGAATLVLEDFLTETAIKS